MKTIETIATITSSKELRIQLVEDLPIGTFKVVLVIDETSMIEEQPATGEPQSFLEAAGDLIGCLEELPPDLSSNQKYMEGFGEA